VEEPESPASILTLRFVSEKDPMSN